jgi:hypothetical protein
MSGGDIFYSQVDANLQLELNARGKAGFSSKTNKDLQFMLEKIANVYITPYTDETKTKEIANASLGGAAMRGGEYMPTGKNGYLSDRAIIQKTRTINAAGTGFDEASTPISNISRRIPPFITGCEINIADNSNGLLNTATFNITIPNPERDLNFIESVYFRPGRNCTIIIEYPTTALVAIDEHNGLLTSGSNPTAKALRDLYKMDPKDYLEQYGQLNSKRFDGVITTFTMQYETDMSVTSIIELRGGATQINELSLITADESKKNVPKGLGNKPDEQTAEEKAAMAAKIEADKKEREANEKGETTNPIFKDFYQNLKTKVVADLESTDLVEGLISVPTITTPSEPQTYIALHYLIAYINTIIDAKLKSPTNKTPNKNIVCNEICTSTYFPNLYSVDPQRILIPTIFIYVEHKNSPDEYRHENSWHHVLYTELDSKGETLTNFKGDLLNNDVVIDNTKIATSQIYVNLQVIEERFKSGNKQSSFSIETFLEGISSEIHAASAGAIDLKLITPPEPDLRDKDTLLYYDTNIGVPKGPDVKPVIPYSVPMFSNHPYGTVIRDFSFSGKLPSDASSLAYAVSINPKEISEKDIAPFLSYMYNNNTVERGDGTESVGTMITQQQLDDINKAYLETHELAITELRKATQIFLRDPTNPVKRGTMAVAMRKYLQYPTPKIQQSNQMKAPIIPFDASFTIDGINGFKYGDVLSFIGLPKRYQENCVFLVVGQTDTVATDGQWTTAIRCLMRPKI